MTGSGNVFTDMLRQSPAALLFAALVFGPASAQADMFKPGVKDQISLGKKASAQIKKEEKVLKDSDPRAMEVQRIGQMLVSLIPADEKKKKPFEYTFNVIDSKDLNAFALPGGPIYVYTGLLDKLTKEDQIVGILAHELTHIRNEHWASAYADNQKRKLGLLVVLSIFSANDTAFNIASVSDELLFGLPYSRKHEQQADDVGYQLLTKAGYNPQGMVDVFEVLMKQSGSGKSTEWMSDHPALQTRINKIKERIKSSGTSYPEERDRDRA